MHALQPRHLSDREADLAARHLWSIGPCPIDKGLAKSRPCGLSNQTRPKTLRRAAWLGVPVKVGSSEAFLIICTARTVALS